MEAGSLPTRAASRPRHNAPRCHRHRLHILDPADEAVEASEGAMEGRRVRAGWSRVPGGLIGDQKVVKASGGRFLGVEGTREAGRQAGNQGEEGRGGGEGERDRRQRC